MHHPLQIALTHLVRVGFSSLDIMNHDHIQPMSPMTKSNYWPRTGGLLQWMPPAFHHHVRAKIPPELKLIQQVAGISTNRQKQLTKALLRPVGYWLQ